MGWMWAVRGAKEDVELQDEARVVAPCFVIPAQAGIQAVPRQHEACVLRAKTQSSVIRPICSRQLGGRLDSRLRGSDEVVIEPDQLPARRQKLLPGHVPPHPTCGRCHNPAARGRAGRARAASATAMPRATSQAFSAPLVRVRVSQACAPRWCTLRPISR